MKFKIPIRKFITCFYRFRSTFEDLENWVLRHFWSLSSTIREYSGASSLEKNPKFTFHPLMTSYMTDDWWRHMHPLQHPLVQLNVIWNKSRDVISAWYHVMKEITPKNPGNELASFLEKNPIRNISIILMTLLKNSNFGKSS